MRKTAIRAAVICCAAFVLSFAPAAVAGPGVEGAYIRPVGGVTPGDPVPPFHAKGLFGEDLDLAELIKEDKKVVLAFWSMYCAACVEKFDAMIAIQKKYEYSGLVVISVNTDGEYRKGEQVIRDFIAGYEKKHGVKVNFPVLYDETNWLALAMNVNFLPTIITVGQDGKIHNIYRRFGESDKEAILAGIENIVADLLDLKGGSSPGGQPAP